MAGMPGIVIRVAADTRDAISGLGKVDKALGKTATGAQKAGRSIATGLKFAAAAGATIAAGVAVDFLGQATSAAIDFNETLSKSRVVFGNASQSVKTFAEGAAETLGISEGAALDAASSFAQLGKAAGLTGGKLSLFSTDLTALAADMASFSNTSVEDALAAIQSGLRGEAEPLRRYGVLLDDATLRAEAMTLGIYSGTGALNQQQKVLASQAAIMRQTADAQGDFARTSDGLANQQKILAAAVSDASVTIGTELVDALLAVADASGGAGGAAENINQTAEEAASLIGIFTDAVQTTAGFVDAVRLENEELEENDGWLTTVAGTMPIYGAGLQALMDKQQEQNDALEATNELLRWQEQLYANLGETAEQAAADAAAVNRALAGARGAAATWTSGYVAQRDAANARTEQIRWSKARQARIERRRLAEIEAREEAKREAEAAARKAKAKAKAKAKSDADAQAKADDVAAYEQFSPPRYNRSRTMALRRADGRAAQKEARTGSRP